MKRPFTTCDAENDRVAAATLMIRTHSNVPVIDFYVAAPA